MVRTFCFTKRDPGPSVGGGSVTVRDDGDVPMVMAIHTMAVEVSHGIYARWVARVLKGLITAIFPSEIRTMVIVHVGWYLLWFIPPRYLYERETVRGWALWQRVTIGVLLPGSLCSMSRGLINQKEALLPLFVFVALSACLALRFRSSSLVILSRLRLHLLRLRFFSSPSLSLSLSLSLSHSLCRSEASFQKGRRCAPPTRSRVSFAAVPREAFASDAAYAENIAEVATHCPGVAVEYSFADDGVISSYYTLWHRRGRPMKPKRILPSARALSSSTPRCLASSCRAPLRIQLRFRSPCSLSLFLSLSLSLSFSFSLFYSCIGRGGRSACLRWNSLISPSSSCLLYSLFRSSMVLFMHASLPLLSNRSTAR